MSLKTKLFSVFASAVAVGTFAVAASAQNAPAVKEPGNAGKHERKGFGHRGGREGFRGMQGLMGVELTEAQQAQIKQIREANKPDAAIMEELKAIHEAQRAGTITEDQKARAKVLREQMHVKG